MKTIKHKAHSSGVTRDHAIAATIEDMEKMWKWSQAECPSALGRRGQRFASHAEFVKAYKHKFMRCYTTSGFTVWTRYVAHSLC